MTQAGIIGLVGADAAAFAHAQFASDILALATGHWHWSAWLNAKGRVIATLLVARLAEQELLLVLPDGDADALAEQLRRFVFRRKVAIGVRQDLVAIGQLRAPPRSGNAIEAGDDGWRLDLGGTGLARTLWIAPRNGQESADTGFAERWRALDLRLGLPRLDASQREQWTPQQIGLDRLGAYSVRKGCYPGQEIVARTHFLGKAKRSTRLLALTVPARAGDAVEHDGKTIGQLASVAGELGLAVLPLDGPEDGLQVQGQAASAQAFAEGLAR